MQRMHTRALRVVQKSWPIPLFLCPSLASANLQQLRSIQEAVAEPANVAPGRRYLHVEVDNALPVELQRNTTSAEITYLPWSCPGCGAYTQSKDVKEAGFFSSSRRPVKRYIAARKGEAIPAFEEEEKVFRASLESADPQLLKSLGIDNITEEAEIKNTLPPTPVCDRCHDLIHHNHGVSIAHPTLQAIQDTISESPYKYNHVYHVLDAADFPLSLIPKLQQHLQLTPQRGRNRRAKTDKYFQGRKAEMSFVITRSDLLAPSKEQVDQLMPYLIGVLRDALGKLGKDVRLGNVRCVSSKRGWWTKQIKEEIWKRGGGGWMVGKVNVGKSNLFESIFPKGRTEPDINFQAVRQEQRLENMERANGDKENLQEELLKMDEPKSPVLHEFNDAKDENAVYEEFDLLPPLPEEVAYPIMPTISHLPGTTASPIRLPFGKGKGELIDLPGLARGDLEQHVLDEHKLSLVMQNRLKPSQLSIKPGQSLLLANLIRITPQEPSDSVFLTASFVPLRTHISNTIKATAIQNQETAMPELSITNPGVGEKMASAGIFELKWDVTKVRSGPLTARSAVNLRPEQLHFAIFAADILIEGCGWVEIAVQVRKKDLRRKPIVVDTENGEEMSSDGVSEDYVFPTVEVFSPNGKHIGVRKPMNAWLMGGHQRKPASQRTSRPRMSMKGVKKEEKRRART